MEQIDRQFAVAQEQKLWGLTRDACFKMCLSNSPGEQLGLREKACFETCAMKYRRAYVTVMDGFMDQIKKMSQEG